MRKAGLLVWETFDMVKKMVKPGVATIEIDAAIEDFYRQHNAEPLFKFYPNSIEGGPPFPAVTCISINREVVHGIPSKRKLVEGDVVSVDTGCKYNGWCGDAAVTLPVGKIDPEVQRLLDVTRDVLHLAIRRMGERRWWSEVAEEMQTFVRKAGFSVVEDFVGHGIGRNMHEDPQVPNFVKRGYRRGRNDFRLVAGPGDRGRADGQHGHEGGPRPARPMDPNDRRRQAERPFRTHDCPYRVGTHGADRRAEWRKLVRGELSTTPDRSVFFGFMMPSRPLPSIRRTNGNNFAQGALKDLALVPYTDILCIFPGPTAKILWPGALKHLEPPCG